MFPTQMVAPKAGRGNFLEEMLETSVEKKIIQKSSGNQHGRARKEVCLRNGNCFTIFLGSPEQRGKKGQEKLNRDRLKSFSISVLHCC